MEGLTLKKGNVIFFNIQSVGDDGKLTGIIEDTIYLQYLGKREYVLVSTK
jgi:hypothetical protein